MHLKKQTAALTIAGSDSGGGAGLQADLKTFASLDVHGLSVITCLTAQNPKAILGVEAIRPDMVRLQMEAVFAELPPKAIKTGMLFSAAIIRAIVHFLRSQPTPKPIVDPVMVSTSGTRLLQPSAIKALREELLPLAELVTPNVDEASLLTGYAIRSVEDLRRAARDIYRQCGSAVLVKGGHLRQMRQAVDLFWDGRQELLLVSPFIRGVSTHGTGCTYSAAIAGYQALGRSLPHAVQLAKKYILHAVAQTRRVRHHDVLNHFWT